MSSTTIANLTDAYFRIKGGESVVVDTQSWSYQVYFDVFVPVRMVTSRCGRVQVEARYVLAIDASPHMVTAKFGLPTLFPK